MIAVTFALPDESGVFLKSILEIHKVSGGSLPLYLGKLDGLEIAVLHTGVGEESARSRLQQFFSEYRPEYLISSGFAGGLDPKLQIGGLVIAVNFSSSCLLDSARLFFLNNPSVFFGSLTTQSIPAESVSSKQTLASETGAVAVDMETASIAAVCAGSSVPLLSLRSVSDTALQSLPVPFSAWFDPIGQKARPLSLLLHLAAHPAVLPDFVRFVRGVFQAKKKMAACLRDFIVYLNTEKQAW